MKIISSIWKIGPHQFQEFLNQANGVGHAEFSNTNYLYYKYCWRYIGSLKYLKNGSCSKLQGGRGSMKRTKRPISRVWEQICSWDKLHC